MFDSSTRFSDSAVAGSFSTPLLPADPAVSTATLEDLAERQALEDRVRALIAAEATAAPADVPVAAAPQAKLEEVAERAVDDQELADLAAEMESSREFQAVELRTGERRDEMAAERRELEQAQGQKAYARFNAPVTRERDE